MEIYFIIGISILVKQSSSLLVEPVSRTQLEECAQNIIEHNYEQDVLIIKWSTSDFEIKLDTSTVTTLMNVNLNLFDNWKYKMHLIIINDLEYLKCIFKFLGQNQYLNTKGKYIIISQEETSSDNIMKLAWDYSKTNCGQNINSEIIGNCENIVSSSFPAKVPADLHGCDVNMLTIPYIPYVINYTGDRNDPTKAGLEVTILETIAKRMHFTAKYSTEQHQTFFQQLAKGNMRYPIDLLVKGDIDIIFGQAIAEAMFLNIVDYTLFHLTDETAWWVPRAAQIPKWQNITKIFKNNVWLLILLLFLSISLAWWTVCKLKNETVDVYNHFTFCLLGSYCVLLQGSVPQPQRGHVRALFVMWTFASLLLYTAYQSQLISFLTKPLYGHQISNVDELLSSDLKVGSYPTSYNISQLHAELYNERRKILRCELDATCLNRTAFRRDMATVKGIKFTKYYMNKYYINDRGQAMIVDFKARTITLFPKLCLKKGSPLLERIDQLCLLLQANGMILNWERQLGDPRFAALPASEHEPLTLAHLQGAFYLLLLGLLLASGVFLAEIYATNKTQTLF